VEIATIGYEKTALRDVLRTLRQAEIAALIDVRNLPLSRRAGFSKRQLQAAIEEEGMTYLHLRGLGTPKEGRVAARLKEKERFWQIVERQLSSPEAELNLARAAALAGRMRSCLLCYEADHRVCHRLRVAELMQQRFGFTPVHLKVEPAFE
jgi:uncharacterized protein (DUF488 family)